MTDPIAVGAILVALVLLTMTIGARLMTDIAGLKASIDTYIANVNKLIEQHKADVDKAIADAVARDDAEEAVDLQAVKDQVDAANAKLVLPEFEPSGNS